MFDNRLFQMALRDKLLIEDDIEKRFIYKAIHGIVPS